MAAFDTANPEAVVSPGGVGFDINCGVRLIRTNLHERDVQPVKEQLTQALFDHIPVGVGSKGVIPMTAKCSNCSLLVVVLVVVVLQCCLNGVSVHGIETWRRHSRWEWTGRCARATRGPRTRSTARSTGACCRPTLTRSRSRPRSAASRRLEQHAHTPHTTHTLLCLLLLRLKCTLLLTSSLSAVPSPSPSHRCIARDARRRQPLRGDSGGGRDLRQLERAPHGHRARRTGVPDDPLRVARDGPPGGDGRAGGDGACDEAWPHRAERPAAGVCADREPRGPALPGGHGGRRQLRVGQPRLHDLPRAPGEH